MATNSNSWAAQQANMDVLPDYEVLVRGPVVTIDVGVAAGKGRFLVHKPLLSHHSRFFAGALNGGFKEAVTEHVDLPADDPQVFAFIAAWMYSGNLDVLDHHRKANDRQLLPDEVPRAACETLAEIYYLADRLDMPILQAEVVENLDAAVKSAGDYLPLTAETVIEIWENTVESSELRSHDVAQYAQCLEVIPGFTVEVIRIMRQKLI